MAEVIKNNDIQFHEDWGRFILPNVVYINVPQTGQCSV